MAKNSVFTCKATCNTYLLNIIFVRTILYCTVPAQKNISVKICLIPCMVPVVYVLVTFFNALILLSSDLLRRFFRYFWDFF